MILEKCERNNCDDHKQHGDKIFCVNCRLNWREYVLVSGLEAKYFDGGFIANEGFVYKKLDMFIKQL